MATQTKADAARLNGQGGGRPSKATDASPGLLPDSPLTSTPAALLNPFRLQPRELKFLDFLFGVANFNKAEAYRLAGYSGHRENAGRLARTARVKAAITARLTADAERRKTMDGEEAKNLLSLWGRFDIRKTLPADDPIAQLPDDIALCIKAVKRNKFGRFIEFHDPLRATELLAKIAGVLKETVKIEKTLEETIAESYAPAVTTRVESPDTRLEASA